MTAENLLTRIHWWGASALSRPTQKRKSLRDAGRRLKSLFIFLKPIAPEV